MLMEDKNLIYEFVDEFQGIRVGEKIKIRRQNIPPCSYKVIPAPPSFIRYIRKNGNCFVVRTIQQIDDDSAMIGVEEISGALEFFQVERYFNGKRVINSIGR